METEFDKKEKKKTVQTGQFSMDYLRFGSGEKELIIIPGISLKAVLSEPASLKRMFSDFTKNYTITVFERKNEITSPYDMKDMAEDTVTAMMALEIRKASIYGISQGGMIAQYIAVDHPQMVEKLVLASTASRPNPLYSSVLSHWRVLAEKQDIQALCADFIQKVYSGRIREVFMETIPIICADITKTDLQRFSYLLALCDKLDVYDRLSELRCPCLVLGAEKDAVLGGQSNVEISEKIGCECYLYDGYGHAVYDEAPDFRERIFSFLCGN